MNTQEITHIETVTKALVFYAGDKRYQIPSRMFPIAKRAQMAGFQPKNTAEFNDGAIEDVIDSLEDLPVGYCYTSTESSSQRLKAPDTTQSFTPAGCLSARTCRRTTPGRCSGTKAEPVWSTL